MCLESKKSQQDLFADNANVPKSYPEMSKLESELLGYGNLYGTARILYPTAEQERTMNTNSGVDYH